jgi:hypothetical protein
MAAIAQTYAWRVVGTWMSIRTFSGPFADVDDEVCFSGSAGGVMRPAPGDPDVALDQRA